jgi:Animal haem peroxidase
MSNPDYRKMFGTIKSSAEPSHSDDDLKALADSMVEFRKPADEAQDSKIPAGYTYLGQFIDHDISLNSKGDRFNREQRPWEKIDVDKISNLRNPAFDLETIYGVEKSSDNGAISRDDLRDEQFPMKLRLGKTNGENSSIFNASIRKPYLRDLPRNPDSPIAMIVDKRNDSNLAVAQTQVAFIKFHNAIVSKLKGSDPIKLFNEAREIVIRFYQHIILNDFLPRIVKESVLIKVKEEVLARKNKFYRPKHEDDMFLPLEFSAAAFRTGHSMIRDSYNWNSVFVEEKSALLSQLMSLTGPGKMDGNDSRTQLPSIWLINWNWFYDINGSKHDKEFNFAKRLGTKISSGLKFLLPPVKREGIVLPPPIEIEKVNSLAVLDLFRGRALGLPTGEEVANLIKKETGAEIFDSDKINERLPETLRETFKDKTPLWFYLLAEAELEDSHTLGEVGSRIVAETFLKLLLESPYSILEKELTDDEKSLVEYKDVFWMSQMLQFIAVQNEEFDELNPLGLTPSM